MSAPVRTMVVRHGDAPNGMRWYWCVEWVADCCDAGYGVGGWSLTKLGGRFAIWREVRRDAKEVGS